VKTVKLPDWAKWQERPIDRGRIVHHTYATDGDYLYRRSFDSSDRTTSWSRARLSKRVNLDRDMDVINGTLPVTVGRWEPVIVADERTES